MTTQILLLKLADDQETRSTDLHPPPADLLGHYHVTGPYDAVALAVVPNDVDFANRNRLPMDGRIFVVEEAMPIDEPPPFEYGVTRW